MLHNMRNVSANKSVMWRDTHTQAGPYQFKQTERTSMELNLTSWEARFNMQLEILLLLPNQSLYYSLIQGLDGRWNCWNSSGLIGATILLSPGQSCQNNRTQIRWTECDEQTKSDMKYRSLGGVPEVTAALPYGHTSNGLCLISWHCFIVREKTLITTYFHYLKLRTTA